MRTSAKSKYKIKHLYQKTYKINIWFCFGTPDNYFKKQMKKELEMNIVEQLPEAITYANEKKGLYIIWTRNKNYAHLAHEIFHAVAFIMRDRGLRLSDDSDEAYAYLIEELFEFML
jgi:hypothetical protein